MKSAIHPQEACEDPDAARKREHGAPAREFQPIPVRQMACGLLANRVLGISRAGAPCALGHLAANKGLQASPADEAGDSLSEAIVPGAELGSGLVKGLTLEEFRNGLRHG